MRMSKPLWIKAARIGAGVPKIGLIKRDLTKLGCSREVAVVWRSEPVALWRHDQPTPEGYEPHQRIVKQRVPKCPTLRLHRHAGEEGNFRACIREAGSSRASASCQYLPDPAVAGGAGQRLASQTRSQVPDRRIRVTAWTSTSSASTRIGCICSSGTKSTRRPTAIPATAKSFGRLAGLAQKVLAMTGTPFNGKCLVAVQYRVSPQPARAPALQLGRRGSV